MIDLPSYCMYVQNCGKYMIAWLLCLRIAKCDSCLWWLSYYTWDFVNLMSCLVLLSLLLSIFVCIRLLKWCDVLTCLYYNLILALINVWCLIYCISLYSCTASCISFRYASWKTWRTWCGVGAKPEDGVWWIHPEDRRTEQVLDGGNARQASFFWHTLTWVGSQASPRAL
jgi:hypothetical protein